MIWKQNIRKTLLVQINHNNNCRQYVCKKPNNKQTYELPEVDEKNRPCKEGWLSHGTSCYKLLGKDDDGKV